MIEEIVILLISISGVYFGTTLGNIAESEIKINRDYILLCKDIIFYLLLCGLLFLTIYQQQYYYSLIPIGYYFFNIFYNMRQKIYKQEISNYGFLLFSYILTIYLFNIWLPLIASLIFIYGLPSGSLLKVKKLK